MKRTMSILLALSLLLLLFSIPAGAESNGEDELFSVARAAFPEYASKIHMNYGSTVQSIARQSGVLIVSETKQLNENQQISYQEYFKRCGSPSPPRFTIQCLVQCGFE